MTSIDETPKVYLVRAGASGRDEDYVLENGLAVIGFEEVPSLDTVTTYDDIVALLTKTLPNAKPRAVGNFAGQLWTFRFGMKEGDTVVLPRKVTNQIALGRVVGPYAYQMIHGAFRHTRKVEWILPDLPRVRFQQDLLYSFGAFMTVCNIARNDAAKRVVAVIAGKPDPGPVTSVELKNNGSTLAISDVVTDASVDLGQAAHDQIVAHIQTHFAGHRLANLVEAVLIADGWVTKLSPPGPDGGVDILAGRGPLGLDDPRLCVQVKSQQSAADVVVYRTLQGSMQSFKADQGLLVCWGGFNRVVLSESKQGHFSVRLWDSGNLVEAIYRNYTKLPPEIQAELPLKRVWTLVRESEDD